MSKVSEPAFVSAGGSRDILYVDLPQVRDHISNPEGSVRYPNTVQPWFLDFGKFDLDFSSLMGEKTAISFARVINETGISPDVEHLRYLEWNKQVAEENGGAFWDHPEEVNNVNVLVDTIVECSSYFNWGTYSGCDFRISVELTKTALPTSSDDPYNEILHTDLNNSGLPVVQAFWSNVMPTLYSLDSAYIGEGHETLRTDYVSRQPTNVAYSVHSKRFHLPKIQSMPDKHLILADASILPHCRPDLRVYNPALGALEKIKRKFNRQFDDTERIFLRVYVQPVAKASKSSTMGALFANYRQASSRFVIAQKNHI